MNGGRRAKLRRNQPPRLISSLPARKLDRPKRDPGIALAEAAAMLEQDWMRLRRTWGSWVDK